MKDKLKELTICEWAIIVLSFIAVVLIVAGFCVPPMGVIDGSVLTAVGEMFAFGVLLLALHAINKKMSAKIQHGNTSVELNSKEEQEDGKD